MEKYIYFVEHCEHIGLHMTLKKAGEKGKELCTPNVMPDGFTYMLIFKSKII